MQPPALEVEQLSKRYGDVAALEEVSLRIDAGEIFALLGPNGAGKTTLIGAVCGLVRKSAGKVRLFGVDLDEDPWTPRFSLGLVPQEINFDPFFTVQEALRIQLGFYGLRPDPARIREVLEALGLWEKAQSPARTLSGGMKRRLLIAKALVHRPRLVFLDEPTAGVDTELRRELWAYVRRLRAGGTTIVLTTHYLQEAEELADRIGVIDRGRLLLVEEKRALMRRFGETRVDLGFSQAVTELPAPLREAGVTLGADGRGARYVSREGWTPVDEVLRRAFASGLPICDVGTQPAKLEDVLARVLRGEGAQ